MKQRHRNRLDSEATQLKRNSNNDDRKNVNPIKRFHIQWQRTFEYLTSHRFEALLFLWLRYCANSRRDEMKRIRWTINLNLGNECSIWWTIIWECKLSIGMLYFQCHFETTNDWDIFFSAVLAYDVSIAQKLNDGKFQTKHWLGKGKWKQQWKGQHFHRPFYVRRSIETFTVFWFHFYTKMAFIGMNLAKRLVLNIDFWHINAHQIWFDLMEVFSMKFTQIDGFNALWFASVRSNEMWKFVKRTEEKLINRLMWKIELQTQQWSHDKSVKIHFNNQFIVHRSNG